MSGCVVEAGSKRVIKDLYGRVIEKCRAGAGGAAWQ